MSQCWPVYAMSRDHRVSTVQVIAQGLAQVVVLPVGAQLLGQHKSDIHVEVVKGHAEAHAARGSLHQRHT